MIDEILIFELGNEFKTEIIIVIALDDLRDIFARDSNLH
jgi:hypothetical protein